MFMRWALVGNFRFGPANKICHVRCLVNSRNEWGVPLNRSLLLIVGIILTKPEVRVSRICLPRLRIIFGAESAWKNQAVPIP